MKELVIDDLMQKTVKELVKMRNDLKKELFEMKMKNSMRWLKQTHLISVAKANVARINTALNIKIKDKDGDNRK